MNDATKTGMSRRRLLKVAGTAAAGAAALGQFPRPAHAHDLTLSDPLYHFAQYEAIANRAVTFRQVYAWPNINNPLIFGNASNGMNSFIFSYGVPEGDIQVIVQAYASANLAMYNDMLWQKYSLGPAYGITDPATKQPAVRNIWYHSPNPAPDTRSSDRANPYYSDTSMEGLQRRGVLFLTWHQTLHAHAGQAFSSGRNPSNLTQDQIVDEFDNNLVPGALLIPAAVGELVRLQDKGFRLVVNA